MHLSTFLKVLKAVAPVALQYTPLHPISHEVADGIGEAQQLAGASGADKLAHVVNIAVDAANAKNAQAGKVVVDPDLVRKEAAGIISDTVDAIKLIHNHA